MLRIGDEAFAGLVGLGDAEELCRRLLASPFGWARSTRHQEAVELLASVSATSELPTAFVALMICTCQRWDRVTARLITSVEQSGLLGASDLDELAQSLLSHEHTIAYPLAWASPEWLEIELDDGNGHTQKVTEDTVAHHRPRVEPPLRRWAARRTLNADPARPGCSNCSPTRTYSKHVTAMRSFTACSTLPTCSTSHSDTCWSSAAWMAASRACVSQRLTCSANSTARTPHIAEPARTRTRPSGSGRRRSSSRTQHCSEHAPPIATRPRRRQAG